MAITNIEASEMLMDITISSFPHMKPQKQKEIHKSLFSKLKSEFEADNKPLSVADFAKRLAATNG